MAAPTSVELAAFNISHGSTSRFIATWATVADKTLRPATTYNEAKEKT